MFNEIWLISGLCQLFSRHAVTHCSIKRYVVFPDCADFSSDMRNANLTMVLWRTRRSDYAADMRNSNAHKDLWILLILARPDRARAPLPDVTEHTQTRYGSAECAASDESSASIWLLPSARKFCVALRRREYRCDVATYLPGRWEHLPMARLLPERVVGASVPKSRMVI
jgi:hypothetical protein